MADSAEQLERRLMLSANTLDVVKVNWGGQLVEAVRNEYVFRMPQTNARTATSVLDYQHRTPVVPRGWSLQKIGSGFFKLTAPNAAANTLVSWARSNGAQSINVNAVRVSARVRGLENLHNSQAKLEMDLEVLGNPITLPFTLDLKNPQNIVLEAAKAINIAPEVCVYVGDDLRDVQAAHAAGMTSVAVRWGYLGDGPPIERWNAHHIVRTPKDLHDLLETLC